jgi:hypothetical protein
MKRTAKHLSKSQRDEKTPRHLASQTEKMTQEVSSLEQTLVTEIILLNAVETKAFVEPFLNPPEPNTKLRQLMWQE